MFQVTAISYVQRGIKATLILDDPADLMFLRFMREAERFAELFTHKVRIARRVHDRELDAPRRLAKARGDRGRLLAAYRSLSGSRRERMKRIRILLAKQGRPVTVDGLAASLSLATEEDREVRARRIHDLSDQGRSVREIARILGIPPATVDRLKKIERKSPVDGDLPSPLGEGSPPYPIAPGIPAKCGKAGVPGGDPYPISEEVQSEEPWNR